MNNLRSFIMSYGVSMLVAGTIVGFILYRFTHTNEELGIYPSPDGNAVYISGEACTVNYSPDKLIMYQRMKWCYEEYVRNDDRLPSP